MFYGPLPSFPALFPTAIFLNCIVCCSHALQTRRKTPDTATMKDSPGGGTLRTRTLCRYSGSCKVSRSLTIDGPGENPDKHTATPSHRTNHILVPAAQPLRHRLRGRAHRPWPVRSQYNRYFTQPRDINTEIATLSAFFNSGSCLVLPPPWLGVWFPSE